MLMWKTPKEKQKKQSDSILTPIGTKDVPFSSFV